MKSGHKIWKINSRQSNKRKNIQLLFVWCKWTINGRWYGTLLNKYERTETRGSSVRIQFFFCQVDVYTYNIECSMFIRDGFECSGCCVVGFVFVLKMNVKSIQRNFSFLRKRLKKKNVVNASVLLVNKSKCLR